ncbi:MAG: spore coat protein GerQ [Mycoplasmatota bacterium]
MNYYNNYEQNYYLSLDYFQKILEISNKSKIKVFMSFPHLSEGHEFEGIIEKVGKDYIMISSPKSGKFIFLPTVYINYIVFDENIIDNIKNNI